MRNLHRDRIDPLVRDKQRLVGDVAENAGKINARKRRETARPDALLLDPVRVQVGGKMQS